MREQSMKNVKHEIVAKVLAFFLAAILTLSVAVTAISVLLQEKWNKANENQGKKQTYVAAEYIKNC